MTISLISSGQRGEVSIAIHKHVKKLEIEHYYGFGGDDIQLICLM